MSHRALQRIMVRMLFDASYARRVGASPDDALAGEDLTDEERRWLAAPDARAWRADQERPLRALTVLAQEFPTSVALVSASCGGTDQLRAFFSSLEFHACVRNRGSMALAFGDFLTGLTLASIVPDPRLPALARLERAIVGLRRGAPAKPPVHVSSSDWYRASPDKALHACEAGTADLHDEIYEGLPPSGAALAQAVLAGGRGLPRGRIDPGRREHILLELGRDEGPRVKFPVGIAEITAELAALLAFASRAATAASMAAEAVRLGAEQADAPGIITSLIEDGTLVAADPA